MSVPWRKEGIYSGTDCAAQRLLVTSGDPSAIFSSGINQVPTALSLTKTEKPRVSGIDCHSTIKLIELPCMFLTGTCHYGRLFFALPAVYPSCKVNMLCQGLAKICRKQGLTLAALGRSYASPGTKGIVSQ